MTFSIVLLMMLDSKAPLLAGEPKHQDKFLHVEVRVQLPPPAPIGYLTPPGESVVHIAPKDFVLTQGGRRFPVQVVSPRLSVKIVTQPYIPTRLLVYVDAQTANSPALFSPILAELKSVWPLGWQVAVAQIDGKVSAYATNPDQLRHNFAALAGSSVTAKAALQEMQSFLGRRVVVYVGDTNPDGANLPYWVGPKAEDAMADLFIVDNGRSIRQVDARGELAPLARDAARGGGGYMPDQMGIDKLSLRGAIRKALQAAPSYYDLRIPLRGIDPNAPISLKVNRDLPMMIMTQVIGTGVTPDVTVNVK
ncbi:hypothetical protein [Terracidiphilus sp.]|uniref:hypothetical protein n=1 Tax=Terracidiphilus sp. TaxID=1964191 RepID=UPI003C28DCA7